MVFIFVFQFFSFLILTLFFKNLVKFSIFYSITENSKLLILHENADLNLNWTGDILSSTLSILIS